MVGPSFCGLVLQGLPCGNLICPGITRVLNLLARDMSCHIPSFLVLRCVRNAGVSPWLLSLASLKLFPASSLELPLRTYGCGEPLQTAQLIATHFREKQVALLSYHNPQTGNPSSFVTQGDLKWWLLTGQSFEQILSGGMSTGMILILVFSALIVVSASIAALRACWVAAQFFWRSKKTVFRKLQQHNRTCNFNSWMWLLRAQICEIAIVRSEGAQAASGFCSPETGLSAAAILVLFECLEHPEWQIQKDAIMRLKRRAARDVVRETLIKHAVGLPDTPAVSSRHDPMIFPAKSFARRDREIVKALGVLVHEKLEVVGQVQNCCPAELAMKAVGAQWCQTTLKHRNPEVYLAFAIAFPWAKGQVHMHCFAGLEDNDSKVRMATVQCLGNFCVNLVQNPTALQFPGNKASKNLANLNDVPSLFESVISALADALGDENKHVRASAREALESFRIAFTKLDERRLQETNVVQVSDSHDHAHCSSAGASVTEVKAMLQCCLNGCLLALQSEKRITRWEAARIIEMCGGNLIKNLSSWLTPAGDEFCANMAKLNDVPSLFESVISALANALQDEDGDVRDRVREAFKSFLDAFDKFDERLMLQETDVGQASDSHGPTDRSSASALVTEMKAAMWQCCLDRCLLALQSKNWRIRRDAVQLIGMCGGNLIKNLSSWLTPAGDEFCANMAKLNDVPSLFESVISALANALQDEDCDVRDSVQNAFMSFWIAFDKFDEKLMLQETDVGQASDSHGPTDRSSASALVTEMKAAMWQCCLDRCLLALKSKNWRIRHDAVQLIGMCGGNLIENLSSWLTPAGDEFCANMAKLNDVPSLFESVISALANALQDEDGDVQHLVREAFMSFWIAFDKFDEKLMLQETDVGQASDSHGPKDRSSASALVTEMKAAMWQCCLDRCLPALKSKNWRIRHVAVQLIGMCAENQIKNLASGMKPSRNEVHGFSLTIPAVAKMLGDKEAAVRRTVPEALGSFLNAFAEFPDCLPFKTSCSDGPGPADLSSGSTAPTRSKALLLRCCLQGCMVALQDEDEGTKCAAALALGKITFGYVNPEIAATLEDLLSSSQAFLSALGKNGAGCSFIGFLHGFGAINSVTEVAAMRQCCLNQGLLALQSKDGRIRHDAAQLIEMCGGNLIKNLSSWLTPAGDEFCANMAKLNDVPSLFESVISALANALQDEDGDVRDRVREAFKSFLDAFDKFDERLMLQETDVGQASDSHGPTDRSSASALVTEMKAAMWQCCLDRCLLALKSKNWRIRRDAVQLIRMCAENQIKNLSSWLTPAGDEFCANMAKLNDVPSLFESVISALANALQDEDCDVRDSVQNAFMSFWIAFDKFDEKLMLQETDVGQASDSHGPTDRSSGCASVTEVKAAMWQCCLDRCLLALQSKNWRIRRDAVQLIGMCAENQIKNLSSWLTPAGDEFCANMAKLNDVPSLFESVISALANALQDEDGHVRDSVREAFKSFWIAFDKFDERLMLQETDVGQASDSHDPAYPSSGCLDRCLLALQSKNGRIRRGAVQLIGMCGGNLIENLSSWLTPAGDEFCANMAKLNDVPSLFESVISALANALQDEDGDVRDSVREAFMSFWIAFDKFDERLMLQETDVGQASDSHDPAYRSSGCASVTEVKAAMWQCCLDRCLLALQSKNGRIRRDAVQLIGMCAENQIKNLSSWLTPAGDEFCGGVSWFELTIPTVVKLLGDEAAVRQTVIKVLVSFFQSLQKVAQVAHQSFIVFLIECSVPVIVESLSHDDLKRSAASAIVSIWHTLEKVGEDCSLSDEAEPDAFSPSTSLGPVKTQMASSCLDGFRALLSDDDRSVRLVAAKVLRMCENHKIKSLALALRDPERGVPVSATELQRKITSFEGIVIALSPLVEDLSEMKADKKVTAIEVVGSFWDCLDEFDEHAMLKATEVCCNSEESQCINSLQRMKTVVLEDSRVTHAHRIGGAWNSSRSWRAYWKIWILKYGGQPP